jgi:hypothetical protein
MIHNFEWYCETISGIINPVAESSYMNNLYLHLKFMSYRTLITQMNRIIADFNLWESV